jgi:exodeoxyribonuclease VII small subunit
MAQSEKKLKFEDAMRRLEQIVEAMEQGQIGVEESVARFEEAQKLAGECRKILDSAELRIQQIQRDAQGGVSAKPLAANAAEATEDDSEA